MRRARRGQALGQGTGHERVTLEKDVHSWRLREMNAPKLSEVGSTPGGANVHKYRGPEGCAGGKSPEKDEGQPSSREHATPRICAVAPKFADAAEERQFPLAARHAVPSDAPSLLDLGSSSLSPVRRESVIRWTVACVCCSLFLLDRVVPSLWTVLATPRVTRDFDGHEARLLVLLVVGL
ncbi:hypothetical protein HPB47_021484 [Ixodes persulcatus]|uniref:Uncharacterized protein n=1 Tax=Ixodes persulcatus TaxID=34615 RepID=A0AC60QCN8_IXOPE|nr:hypothetical protein HPB47_021484 [Ixodes persulcatus]